jgi:pyrroloquinoline quinone biosynthesis protein B
VRWNLLPPLALAAVPLLAFAAVHVAAAASPEASANLAKDQGPKVIVLGTVQDGGMPQIGCTDARCTAARKDPRLKRHVASLAIDFPKSDHTYMIDATPDFGDQIEKVHTFRHHPDGRVDRMPLDGILLTHAHIGHYLGLAFLGFESLNTSNTLTWCSPRMAEFLRTNGPWSQLVKLKNIDIHEFEIGKPFPLEEGVTATAIQVPHRDEFSDTMGFLLKGPRKSLFYVPDTDTWTTWKTPVTEILKDVDYAIVDATFYSPDELPDRDVTKIKHPLITVSMDLLEPLVKKGRLKVYFTHMNHSNPALDAGGPARKAIEARGFRVLDENDEFPL